MLYLTTNADTINTTDRPLLFFRVQRALSKAFRKEFNHNRLIISFAPDDDILTMIDDNRNDVETFDNIDEARFIINRAAINAGAADFLPLFFAIINGATQHQAADSFGVSLRTISRYWSRFKAALKELNQAQDAAPGTSRETSPDTISGRGRGRNAAPIMETANTARHSQKVLPSEKN